MRARWFLLLGGMVAAGAMAAPTSITLANYVETGDAIVDVLDTSGLAFSTIVLGGLDAPRPRHAAFGTPRVPRAEPFDTPCPGGGSVSGSIADLDADGQLSVHDRFVTAFHACRLDDVVVSGSSEFVVTAHRDEGAVEVTQLRFRFKALGTDALRWTGPATVTLRTDRRNGSEHYVVDYHDVAVMRDGKPLRWNYRLEMRRPPIGDQTARVDGALTVGQMILQLVQDEPFVLAPDGTPRSGRLVASDADGDRLQVDAGGRRYAYRFFSRGNHGDVPDSISQSRPHASR